MLRYLAIAAIALNAPHLVAEAQAQATVECRSRHYQYDECYAGPLSRPQLIHQTSSAPCILNRTWGYNPNSQYVWVAQGCAGVFADVGGYHYGRGDGFDPGARMYDHRGHDIGGVVAGAVLGSIIEGIAEDSKHKHHHTTSNFIDDDGFNGCHGIGCTVDNPDSGGNDNVDTTPQFDKDGNPNFDTQGNYQGCHGVGCLVDNPDDPG
ncbi:DUF3011 domain-containing protein [Rhizobium sp. LCM 4573]|uniref:DUF3011 domain-containing protein n=1 Tax=Rhizobium sp. LCM 4573 TaxID=1848291 RepID=UPI0009F2A1F6|nr:DUF3011 domain-containing protein [Rhizobium sp. LCM 4573]